jgi:predicted O-linked N-acetylglucosamine transferase (SPINDLY family)
MADGVDLHGQGRLDEAANIYRQILAKNPQDFDATQLLGVVALQQGQYEVAQRLIGAAIAISSHDSAAIGNLGVSYMSDGRTAAALEWFLVALKLAPDSVSALFNVGMALQKLGRHRQAIPVLQKALSLDPNHYDACIRLGECLALTGESREAVDAFESATLVEPRAANAWAKLAAAWESLGDQVRARECFDRARGLGYLPELVATTITEDSHSSRPSAHVLRQTAYALLANGLNEDAIDRLRRALELEPTSLTTRVVLAIAHLQAIYESPSAITSSRERFSESIAEISTWYRQHAGELSEHYQALGVLQPFSLAYHPFNNRELLGSYGKLCATLMATLPSKTTDQQGSAVAGPRSSLAGGRIRLGIASPHVKEHSVWNAITKGWVDHIDPTKFEIYLFQLNRDADSETERARALVARVVDAPVRLVDWVDAIRASELDVLIYPSVGMDPLTQQLASLRLAPVQAVTWGHPETTGFPTMDLYLSGEFLESSTADAHYSERLVRLPNLGVYVEALAPPQADLDLSELGLPDDEPLLLCPGTPFKYSPLFDHVWIEIAKGLRKQLFRKSRGRLVFFRSRIAAMDRALEARLRAAFAAAGVDFDANVSIIATLDRPRYYALMRRSALLLDTLGFSGFNTAIQGLECDLPVLAFEGEFMRGRLASGLLRKLDLPELVATTAPQFVEKALDLAQNGAKRDKLRIAIAERKEMLFRDLSAVRGLEECLTKEVHRARATRPA